MCVCERERERDTLSTKEPYPKTQASFAFSSTSQILFVTQGE